MNTVSINLIRHFDTIKFHKTLVGAVIFKVNKRSSEKLTPGLQFSNYLCNYCYWVQCSCIFTYPEHSPKRLINIAKSRINLSFLFTITPSANIWVFHPLSSQRVGEIAPSLLQYFIIHPCSKMFHLPYYSILFHYWSNQISTPTSMHTNSFLFTFAPHNSQHKTQWKYTQKDFRTLP